MNCSECRDNLIACIEGLLGDRGIFPVPGTPRNVASCRAEYASIAKLQQQLVARGQAAADVSIVEPVMRRVRAVPVEAGKEHTHEPTIHTMGTRVKRCQPVR